MSASILPIIEHLLKHGWEKSHQTDAKLKGCNLYKLSRPQLVVKLEKYGPKIWDVELIHQTPVLQWPKILKLDIEKQKVKN